MDWVTILGFQMAVSAVLLEREIFSLSNRPFQEAKENRKIICCECFKIDGVVNFFAKESGLKQHFRTIHRNTDLNDTILAKCKGLFQDFHGEETTKVIQQLCRLRLQTSRDNATPPTHSEFRVRMTDSQVLMLSSVHVYVVKHQDDRCFNWCLLCNFLLLLYFAIVKKIHGLVPAYCHTQVIEHIDESHASSK